jgi:hypothetical protein
MLVVSLSVDRRPKRGFAGFVGRSVWLHLLGAKRPPARGKRARKG